MLDVLASLDSPTGLAVLAALAFGDTLIGVSFFVFGELAFLAAGAAFAATGAIIPALIVLLAAFAGDIVSYFIGRRYGMRVSRRFLRRLKRRQAWRRAQTQVARRGALFVVVARFMGPTAWVTPFLVGTLEMPAAKFLPAAALGVFLGVGQFLIYGAIGGGLFAAALPFVTDHLAAIALALSMALIGIVVWRRSKRPLPVKSLQVASVVGAVFLASNILYFFILPSHPVPNAPRPAFQSTCEASEGPFFVEPGETDLHLAQPVNVILISDRSGADLMTDLGWYRNATFTHNDIGLFDYLRLVLESTPPISELYLSGMPADSAHQMPGTLKVREHIRWWSMGAGIHYGAISKTDEIAIKYYNHLPVLLHDIDPQVDVSRGVLASQIEALQKYEVVGIAPLSARVDESVDSDYETDGNVLVIAEAGSRASVHFQECLRLAADDRLAMVTSQQP